jgi:preprotein translocase subunit SecB
MVEVYVIGGDFGPELNMTQKVSSNGDGDNIATTNVYKEVEYNETTHPYKRFASDITYQGYFDKYGFKADALNKFLSLPSVNVIATYVGSLIPNFTNKLNQNIWIEDLINRDTLLTGLLCSEDIDMIESANIDDNNIVNEPIDIIGHNFHMSVVNNTIDSVKFLSYGFSQDRLDELNGLNSDNINNLEYFGEIEVHPKASGKYINADGKPLNVDSDNEIVIKMSDFTNKNIKIGDLLLSYVGSDDNDDFSRLTRVIETKPLYILENGKYKKDANHIRVVCSDVIKIIDGDKPYVLKYNTIDNICDRLHWTFLKGFKVSEESMPNGTNERQNEILEMISENNEHSNLYKSLIDRDYVQWRYVVDTFGYGIEDECKKVYGLLCKGRQSGFAFVNAPSMKDFKKSIEPSFVDEYGAVQSEFVAKGGHLDGSPVGMFSLPKEENGASWCAYFYPYLKISDLAAVKTVPPAAYVSNLYMAKYTSYTPWSIVAGPKRGVISGNQVVGIEGSLIHSDREFLEPMGINPIVWENGVGVEIFANKTAKQTPQSALSSIHAREACIYIQDNVESILKKYNWEANTARNREEIKTLVDSFLSNMKQGDGLYDFKTVMDTSNNTSEVIDRNMGVIDIYVEIVRGLEILAQRLTVLKTGSIESGNFE